jgi:hypothetical protein
MNLPAEVKTFLAAQAIVKKGEAEVVSTLQRSAEMDRESSTPAQEPARGLDKWAADGFAKLERHGAKDLDREALFNDPKLKDLLIQASDLKPGSKAMDALLTRIKDRTKKDKE